MTTTYVCGYAFNEDKSRVALITKNRPEFLAGKMVGIGGKVEENESPPEAMVREFEEEAGTTTNINDWQIIGKMRFFGGEVIFYGATLSDSILDSTRTLTDEIVSVESVQDIMTGLYRKFDVDGYIYFVGYLTKGDSFKEITISYTK